MTRYWAATEAEFDARMEAAKAKYAPLAAKLDAAELIGLLAATRDALEVVEKEARALDIQRGHRPPGTLVGAR
jgi:hypothetical protein